MGAVRVQLVGALAVMRDGSGAEASVGSRKARLLLALLAAHRGAHVPLGQIVDALWCEQPPQRPHRAVATLVSRLRAELGRTVVVGGPAGYRLGGAPAVSVDLDEGGRLVEHGRARLAQGSAALAVAAARTACGLLDVGPVLADIPEFEWVRALRSEQAALLRSARQLRVEAALLTGEITEAVTVAEAAAGADSLDETAHRLLMRAHQSAGEPARALTAYERLRATLAEELGVDPAPETRAVHEQVLAEAGLPVHGGRTRAHTLPGREAELAVLSSAWADATAGRVRIVLVAGEGGIGKTRLADELRIEVGGTGGRVLWARCYPSERSLFLQPLVDALAAPLATLPPERLRTLAGSWGGALSELWPHLSDALPAAGVGYGSVDMQVRRVFEAITTLLRGLSAERPVLLVLDDLHNAGAATVDLLHHVGRHASPSRLFVLATVRTAEGAAVLDALTDVSARVDLGLLPPAAVTRLVTEAGRPEQAESILHRTRGHPLFVVETLRGLVAGEAGPPATLTAAVLSRVSRLGPETEAVVRAGAVLGASVDPEQVARMLDLAPHTVARCCADAAAEGLLVVADRRFDFANDLIQEVLYATTPPPVRIVHHRRAADLFASTPEVVGRHAAAAEDWPRAARAFLLAGEHALRRFAAADAEALFTSALEAAEHCGDPELLCRALLGRGTARDAGGRYRPALGDFQAALATARQAGDRRAEMGALHGLGGHAAAALGCPVEDSIDRLRAALVIAESLGDREASVDLLARLAVLQTNRLRFSDAVVLGRRAVADARAARTERALVLGLDGLKNAYAYLGEVGPLTEVIAELEPLLRRTGDLERLQWTVFEAAIPAIAAADWDAAERRILEAIHISRRSGLTVHEVWFTAHHGWVARLRGRFDEAMARGRAAVALARGTSDAWFAPAAAAFLGCTLLEAGDSGAAATVLREGLDGTSREGAEAYRLRCLAPLADATGDPDALAEAESLFAELDVPAGTAYLLGADIYLCLARAHLRCGAAGRARTVLAPLLSAAERLDWLPLSVAAGLLDTRARAALGDPGAEGARRQLAVLAERHGMARVLQARCNTAATRPSKLVPADNSGERERRHGSR